MTNDQLLTESFKSSIETIRLERVEILKIIDRMKEINESNPCRREYGQLASLAYKIRKIKSNAKKENIYV